MRNHLLKICADISFPIDVATQKLAFMGRTGSGKTYAAMKLAELMLEAGAQIVALDPVGKWHGLRLAGNGPGFEIPVFGGLQGDIPIEPSAGALIADVIVDRNISAVIDTSQMVSSDQARFATAFATRLFQRKKAAPSAIHLFIEECQEFVPQNCQRGEEHMLHAFERIVKLGRNFGIGDSLISQRPQEVNKKALNQTEVLFAFQMTGPQERKAMVAWMGELADKGTAIEISDSLPKLADHDCIIWSPAWLKIKKTTRVLKKRTADVSSTPKVGVKSKPSAPLTPIDLAALRESMSATIEKAKADDPKLLREEIRRLEKIVAFRDVNIKPEKIIELIEVPVAVARVPRSIADRVIRAKHETTKLETELSSIWAEMNRLIESEKTPGATNGAAMHPLNARVASSGKNGLPESVQPRVETIREKAARIRVEAPKTATPIMGNGDDDGESFPNMKRAILTALAQHPACSSQKIFGRPRFDRCTV